MKIKTTFTLLFIVLIFSAFAQTNQQNPQGEKEGKWIVRYPNGKIKYQANFKNGKPVGEMKRFHENGNPKALLNYRSSGKIAAELFNKKGKLIAQGNYLDGKKDSTWNYYEESRIIATEHFEKGEKNGTSKTFYKNGAPLSLTHWKNNLETGTSEKYYENGNIKEKLNFTAGKCHGPFTSYFPGLKIAVQGKYIDNYPDSVWTFFNEDGSIKFKLTYKMGNLQNQNVLDSIKTLELNEMEKNKKWVTDPEKLKNTPSYFYQHRNK